MNGVMTGPQSLYVQRQQSAIDTKCSTPRHGQGFRLLGIIRHKSAMLNACLPAMLGYNNPIKLDDRRLRNKSKIIQETGLGRLISFFAQDGKDNKSGRIIQNN